MTTAPKPVPFSRRTGWDLTENEHARALEHARSRALAEGRVLVDLTESNPTRAGLGGGHDLVALLGHPRGAGYSPASLGHPAARAAVAGYYRERGLEVEPDRVCLSASTSEAYGWLFKLLTEPGDRVLIPAPSYPLFSFLAELEGVELVPYPLLREASFRLDLEAIAAVMDERTRAIILVHPNNPTGSFVRRDEAEALDRLCAGRGVALIVDEVFGDYPFGALPPDRLPSFARPCEALTFVLSGLSKVVGMPQLKLGWTVTSGAREVAGEAMRRLEVIADTYLSVNTPVQLALPEILAARPALQAAIRARVERNLAEVDAAIVEAGEGTPVRRLPALGGWYAVLEIPRTRDEDAWVAHLLEAAGVVVHPGYFFDFDREGFLVVSLLPHVESFAAAIRLLVAEVSRG